MSNRALSAGNTCLSPYTDGYQKTGSSALPRHPGHLNDRRCNSSYIEAGVLEAIIGHGPTLPVGKIKNRECQALYGTQITSGFSIYRSGPAFSGMDSCSK
ncbi:hypothetical protein AVEN_37445-1 [Araneus ventricosus]|uniref:Uncharacterized protein n=1 Tax=Araneus ventricosus TaxID=182803 RepID=A0A4Y2FEC9_ARAVE|nr:hypothetical protein AVEN_37445-1 [Araneus ventricosus]